MKEFYYILIFLLVFFLATSCIEVKFETSQPAGIAALENFPESLLGEYINEDGDTLIIENKIVSLLNRKSKCDRLFEQDSLCESIILKKWEAYYFLNLKENNLWTTALMEHLNDNQLLVSLIDAESDTVLHKINDVTQLDTINSDEGEPIYFIVNPVHAELKELVKKGAFSQQYTFIRISN